MALAITINHIAHNAAYQLYTLVLFQLSHNAAYQLYTLVLFQLLLFDTVLRLEHGVPE